jgi:hypothetical protein
MILMKWDKTGCKFFKTAVVDLKVLQAWMLAQS